MSNVVAYNIIDDGINNDFIYVWLLLNDNRLIRITTGNNIDDVELQDRARIDPFTINDAIRHGLSIREVYLKYHLKVFKG